MPEEASLLHLQRFEVEEIYKIEIIEHVPRQRMTQIDGAIVRFKLACVEEPAIAAH